MKLIRFLLKFTFVCNIAFLLFVFFRWAENNDHVSRSANALTQVPFFKGLIITLGFSAIIINLVMSIMVLVFIILRRQIIFPKWLLIANFIFLLIQIWYFF